MLTGFQLAAARALVGARQKDLAEAVGLSSTTLRNMEARGNQPISARAQTVREVQAELEAAGVLFLPADETGGVGVRMGKAGEDRVRK